MEEQAREGRVVSQIVARKNLLQMVSGFGGSPADSGSELSDWQKGYLAALKWVLALGKNTR